jgi:hypothetical protein
MSKTKPMAPLGDALAAINTGLEALRDEIAEKRAEIDAVRDAPLTRDEAISRLDQDLVARAAQYRPIIADLVAPDGACGSGALLWPRSHQDGEAWVRWLLTDLIRPRLIAEIDKALAEKPTGLPLKDRPAAIQRLDADLLGLELREEAIIRAAEEHGFNIPRRPDADPRAVLAHDGDLKAARP